MKYVVLALVAMTMIGCASTFDIENLQGQIDSLQPKISALAVDTATTRAVAEQAMVKASNAEVAANKAAALCVEMNQKLDRLFKKVQQK